MAVMYAKVDFDLVQMGSSYVFRSDYVNQTVDDMPFFVYWSGIYWYDCIFSVGYGKYTPNDQWHTNPALSLGGNSAEVGNWTNYWIGTIVQVTSDKSLASNVGIPIENETILNGTSHPDYQWYTVIVPTTSLFTNTEDTVNFNSLSQNQNDAIKENPDSIYKALGGNDVVTLPSNATSL